MFGAIFDVLRSPTVTVSPGELDEFAALVAARNACVAQLDAIEAEITQQAQTRAHDSASLGLWLHALRVGRGPEIDALAQAGQTRQEALQAFARERGFSSPERMAKVCGLPSPSPRVRG